MLKGAPALILDASVLINILAIESPEKVFGAIGGPVLAVANAAKEVLRDPRTGGDGAKRVTELARQGHLRVVELGQDELGTFLSLVGAETPNDLDDGEAATIAYAHHRNCAIVLDDGKARRIVRERFSQLELSFSIDLLINAVASRHLTNEEGKAAVQDALKLARMRIPATHRERLKKMLEE